MNGQAISKEPGMEVTGGPLPFKIKGVITFLCVIIAALLYGYSRLVDFSIVDMKATLASHDRSVEAQHQSVKDAIDNLTYVTALPQKKREELAERLKIPESLKEKLKGTKEQ